MATEPTGVFMITWEDTINIIIGVIGCKQEDIAKSLYVNKSVLSKVKSGRQNTAEGFDPPNIYIRIFDTTNNESLVCKKGKKDEKNFLKN